MARGSVRVTDMAGILGRLGEAPIFPDRTREAHVRETDTALPGAVELQQPPHPKEGCTHAFSPLRGHLQQVPPPHPPWLQQPSPAFLQQ